TRAKVVEAADVIDDRKRCDVVDQGVDREVAPEGVLFGRPERVVVVNQVFAFGRTRIGRGDTVLHDLFTRYDLSPERCDFDDLGAELDVRQPEASSDDPAVAEELLDLIWMR